MHQYVDASNFEKIATTPSSKAVWNSFVKCYDKVKKVRLQSLRRKYELMRMEKSEGIVLYSLD